MKKITLIILSISLFAITSNASIDEITVDKLNTTQENTVTISSRFGEAFIDGSTDLTVFKDVQIHHVDLVYTAFRETEDFDQRALNESRMRGLIKLLPQLAAKDPTWRAIRQTGATTLSDARQYFHGFILHIGGDLSYESQAEFFESFQQEPLVKKVDNSKSTAFTIASGTSITIPPNAVVDIDGNAVKGAYDLEYKEFRDQADIVFSGIPMTYNKSGTSYNFSSVGMYEIRATQNGKALQLAKPIQLDFNATAVKEDVGFFKMKDETGEWEKIQDLEFDKVEGSNPGANSSSKIAEMKLTDEKIIQNIQATLKNSNEDEYSWGYTIWEGHRYYIFSKKVFPLVMNHLDTMPHLLKHVVGMDRSIKLLKVKDSKDLELDKAINKVYFGDFGRGFVGSGVPGKNDKKATLLAEGSSDAGHTYPTLVKGLNSSEFGVYNCDQIYRIGKAKTLSPKYVDAQTGQDIKGKHVTCVLDMTFNGSFSFQPNNIVCNLEGENVILLFTNNKKIYVLNAEEFEKAKSSNNPVFAMTDMTDKLKSSADLRAYLRS
ncbi:MAG: hypothetical protein ACI9JN_001584 [Bacteroidia bacterium]|jgi:hypothetical protein